MKIENAIGWCDETTNAVTGCDKVSDGCKNCYAESGTRARVLRSQGIETWGPKGVRHPVKEFATKLRRLNKLSICDGCHTTYPVERLSSMFLFCNRRTSEHGHTCSQKLRRIRLFADSNSDWLDPKWPIETLTRFLEAIRLAPNLDVILLTKRIEGWRSRLVEVEMHYAKLAEGKCDEFLFVDDWLSGRPPANVWIGVSVENQKLADERIPLLLKIPAAVRFLSVEPLLEAVDLRLAVPVCHCGEPMSGFHDTHNRVLMEQEPNPDWIIVGGESGDGRRDCGVDAIASVAEQCEAAGVPCYVKQDCHRLPGQQGRIPDAIWKLKQFPTGAGMLYDKNKK